MRLGYVRKETIKKTTPSYERKPKPKTKAIKSLSATLALHCICICICISYLERPQKGPKGGDGSTSSNCSKRLRSGLIIKEGFFLVLMLLFKLFGFVELS